MTPFSLRETASILRHHLVQELERLQDRIVRVERFGADAVQSTMSGSIGGPYTLDEMLEQHAVLVARIRGLKEASDRASEHELRSFIQSMTER